ncbi:MAG: hypothetical protein LBB89_02890 [Treponema sp.]|nr:hypothetical protein [Treponema sp.]
MKKAFFVIVVLSVAVLCIGWTVPKDLYVAPDPENPFAGTWKAMGGIKAMHIIQGMEGIWYVNSLGWKKSAVYTIEKKGDEYVTSNNWRISVNGNILTVENMTYERFIKK